MRCSQPITPLWLRWSSSLGAILPVYVGTASSRHLGYPLAHEHDAEQAVRAGLALIDRVTRLECEYHRVGEPGRHRHGPRRCRRFDRFGRGARARGCWRDAEPHRPSTRSRRQRTPSWSQKNARLVGDLFDYRDLGAVALKGLAEPVLASQVLSESTVENRFDALRSKTLSPLVGRDEEVQLLLRRWSQAKEGEGQIVLISGEAGIGKSRIVAALQERLEPERPIRMRYFCSPHRGDSVLLSDHCLAGARCRLYARRCPRGETRQAVCVAVPVRRHRSGNRGRDRRLVVATGWRALSTTAGRSATEA